MKKENLYYELARFNSESAQEVLAETMTEMNSANSDKTPILDELRRANLLEDFTLSMSWEKGGQLMGLFIRHGTGDGYVTRIDSKYDRCMKYEPICGF